MSGSATRPLIVLILVLIIALIMLLSALFLLARVIAVHALTATGWVLASRLTGLIPLLSGLPTLLPILHVVSHKIYSSICPARSAHHA